MKTLKELCSKFFNILETDSIQSYAEATGDIFCFRRALEKFLNTGRKEDAFTVYFCFSEIFKLFGTGYDNTKKLLETLSDHEYHSGELLTKHRDHYSHSVYVFALGLFTQTILLTGEPICNFMVWRTTANRLSIF